MSRRDDALARRAARARGAGAVIVLACFGLAAASSAQTVRVYATLSSSDQSYHGPIALPTNATTTIHLWLEGGANPSGAAPCLPGATGDEVCGYDFALVATPGYTLGAYEGDAGFDGSGTLGLPPSWLGQDPADPTNQRLTSNGFDLGTPPIANRRLGLAHRDDRIGISADGRDRRERGGGRGGPRPRADRESVDRPAGARGRAGARGGRAALGRRRATAGRASPASAGQVRAQVPVEPDRRRDRHTEVRAEPAAGDHQSADVEGMILTGRRAASEAPRLAGRPGRERRMRAEPESRRAPVAASA